MSKILVPFAALTLIAAYAGTASAKCDFDIAPAKGVTSAMVRAYAPCPGTEHPTAESETDAGTAACSPVKPREVEDTGKKTDYNFGAKGKCSVSTKAKLVKACEDLKDANGNNLNLEEGPCHITFVKSKCSGILGTDSVANDDSVGTPIGPDDDGWILATLSRATLADDSNGDMTVIDFPVQFQYGVPDNGKISLSSNSAQALSPLVGVNNAELPECTSIELVDVVVKDKDGNPFARLGGATKPK